MIEYSPADTVEGVDKGTQRAVPLRSCTRNTRPVKRALQGRYQTHAVLRGRRYPEATRRKCVDATLRPLNCLEVASLRRSRSMVSDAIERKACCVVN